ncbi:Uncharacterized protein SAMN05216359_106252 [Roseateles sp. YR242]|uniref:WD40/YVTN/BNR-like repeat-containing protein n=1 Tax=Roseateles sp. YR242 TaxID=1855305 RepID=UPI0008CEB2DD|nr:YCF48-related protein [Roseateles sp. YR242]SEL23209.1 Uncharacterized protein SAMN05216359_106252 [Roseateles sp. YR242]
MHARAITRRSCLLRLLGTAGLAGFARAEAAATLDLLDRPAPATTRGPSRLLLDITAGGPGLIAVGEMGLILASADGGTSWQQQRSPTSVMLTAAAFADARRGWAVGHDGVVLGTDDGGATWRRQFDGRQANEAVLASARDALAAARAAPAAPAAQAVQAVQAAEDALASAEDAIKAGPSRPLLAVHVFDARRVMVAGAFGQLFATEDGGAHWRYLGGELSNPEGLHLYGLGVNSQGGLLVAAEQGVVFVAEAAAGRWRRSETGYAGNLHGVLVVPGEAGGTETWLAYGFNGHLFRSVDRGGRWAAASASPSAKTWVQALLAGNAAWLLAEDGHLFVTRDAGQSFQPAPPGTLPVRRYAGFVLDKPGGHLLAVGQGGVQRLSLQRAHVSLQGQTHANPHAPTPPRTTGKTTA